MTLAEAHEILFKGQSNVAKMAKLVGVTTEELKKSFAAYASAIPVDESVWQGDVELAWPWS